MYPKAEVGGKGLIMGWATRKGQKKKNGKKTGDVREALLEGVRRKAVPPAMVAEKT